MKRCIVVLGMHRSGTSLMTGLLQIFGIYLGGDLMGSFDRSNARGHFEHNKIYRMNEEILAELGSSWDDVKELPKNWHKSKRLVEYKDRIKKIIQDDFGKLDLFGLKEPRLAVLLPLYLDIFKELKIKLLFIITKRSEIEVAESLKARDNLSLKHSIELYKKNTKSIEKYTRNHRKIYVDYEFLINHPQEIYEKISKEFQVPFRDYKSIKKEITNFRDPNLKHQNLNYTDFIEKIGEEIDSEEKKISSLNLDIVKIQEELRLKNDLIESKEIEIQRLIKEKNELFEEKEKERDEIVRERDEIVREKDEIVREKERIIQAKEGEITEKNAKYEHLLREFSIMKKSRIWTTVQKFSPVIKTLFPYLIKNQEWRQNKKRLKKNFVNKVPVQRIESEVRQVENKEKIYYNPNSYLRSKQKDFESGPEEFGVSIKKKDNSSYFEKFEHNPKISIIIPVYNIDTKWLDKAVKSVYNQVYKNWELCIADDCSTNN